MNDERKEYQQHYRKQYKSQVRRVNLTLTKKEYSDFVKNSGNQKTTTFIKQLALASLNQQANIPENLETELKTLRFAVRNIANNVNQIAHHSNTVKSMSTADENNLLQHLKQLEEVIVQYTSGRIMENKDDY